MAELNGSNGSGGAQHEARMPGSILDRALTENAALKEHLDKVQSAVFNATIQEFLQQRMAYQSSLLDPRRNIDEECGYPPSGAAVNVAVYKELYNRGSIPQRVVSMFPKECWQVTPEIVEDEGSDKPTDFEQAFDDLEVGMVNGSSYHQDAKGGTIWEHLFRLDVLTGIGHFGVLLLGIDDGKDLQEPIDGAVTVPEGYNPQGSISQTGSITGGSAQAGGYAPTPGAFIQGTDEQYSTGKPYRGVKNDDPTIESLRRIGAEAKRTKDSPDYGGVFYHLRTREVWYEAADGDGRECLDAIKKELSAVDGVKRVVIEAESAPKRDDGWLMVHPQLRNWNSADLASNMLRQAARRKFRHGAELFNKDSPITNAEAKALKELGSVPIKHWWLDGEEKERRLPEATENEKEVVDQLLNERALITRNMRTGLYENGAKWRCNRCRGGGSVAQKGALVTNASLGCPLCGAERVHNRVTEAVDARGRTVYAQPKAPTVVDGTRVKDGSEYGYEDPYASASGTNYSSAAGYGLPAGVAMPAGALSGTDQQYFGVQFGPSETFADKPSGQRRRLLFLRCFDESLVQVVRYEWNVRNPRFGLPVMYRITLNDPQEQHSGVGLPLATVFVHWSRVVHTIDNYQSSGTSEVFSPPRMRPVLNDLLDLRKIYSGDGEGYWKSVVATTWLSTHSALGGDVKVDDAEIRDMFQRIENGLQRYGVLRGFDANTTSIDLKDPTPHIAVHLEAIAIQIGCPIRVLKGSERGEQASNQDDAKWNDRVAHRQHFYVTPCIVCPFIDRLIAIGVLPEPKGYSVKWPDLTSMTDQDKATIAGSITTALGAYVSQNVESMVPPKSYMIRVLKWTEDEADAVIADAKAAHKASATLTNPPQVQGYPAAAPKGSQQDQQHQAKQKAQQAAMQLKAQQQAQQPTKAPPSGDSKDDA